MILRNRLKERRAALNVNQQEMGRLCGVSRQTITVSYTHLTLPTN